MFCMVLSHCCCSCCSNCMNAKKKNLLFKIWFCFVMLVLSLWFKVLIFNGPHGRACTCVCCCNIGCWNWLCLFVSAADQNSSVFDASQYDFFGKNLDEMSLGGLDDDEVIAPVLGHPGADADDEYHLFDKAEVMLLLSWSYHLDIRCIKNGWRCFTDTYMLMISRLEVLDHYLTWMILPLLLQRLAWLPCHGHAHTCCMFRIVVSIFESICSLSFFFFFVAKQSCYRT